MPYLFAFRKIVFLTSSAVIRATSADPCSSVRKWLSNDLISSVSPPQPLLSAVPRKFWSITSSRTSHSSNFCHLPRALFPLFGSSLDAVIPRHSMISRVRFQEADSDGSLRGWIGDNHRFWDGSEC